MRQTICSVTIFLQFNQEYLFLHRHPERKVDANLLNGIGGKCEPGENYHQTAKREIHEEAGLLLDFTDIELIGIGQINDGYPEDWVVAFFRARVSNKLLPVRMSSREGKLVWLTIDQALSGQIELVDDLNHILPLLKSNQLPFFFAAKCNQAEKITEIQLTAPPLSANMTTSKSGPIQPTAT